MVEGVGGLGAKVVGTERMGLGDRAVKTVRFA